MSVRRAALDGLLVAVRERWPGVRVELAALAQHLEERGVDPENRYAVDLVLALAAAAGDPRALAVIDGEILPTVRAALTRYGDDDFVDEVLQRTRVKLLVRDPEAGTVPLRGYQGRGALVAWIQIVAIREALDARRSTKREIASDDALVRLTFTEPVLAGAREAYKRQLNEAFRAAMAELEARERTLLRLCFLDGLGSEDIARLYGVHRATAFRWLRDAREGLLARTRTRFLASLEISEAEAESLMKSLAASLSVAW